VAVKLKNVRPGVLVIADAKLRLAPGREFETETPTPHMERALSSGKLVRVERNEVPLPEPESSPGPLAGDDLAGMPAAEAISLVAAEADPEKLKALLGGEKRKSVMEALKKRLVEVEGGSA
jgi:hypothetical protein